MIRNIVFDLGNVLLTFKPLEYLKANYEDERVIGRLYEHIFKSSEWLELDRGVITDEEAIKKVLARIPELQPQVTAFFEERIKMFEQISGTVEILKKLKSQGFNTYYLTNFHRTSFYRVYDKFDFFRFFNGGVLSAEEKLLKPEREIFLILNERYALIPSETAFLDDTEENIAAASGLGFQAIHFKNPRQAACELVKLGVDAEQ